MDGFYIQIVQTNPEIAITVMPVNRRELSIGQIIDLFFIKSGEIKENTLSQLEIFPGGSLSKPDRFNRRRESMNHYWGHTCWWTNGESFAFLIMKYYGGKGIPFGLPKNWF